eukprot:6000163-Alexandrium_andersonii.AAC.1
MSSAIGHVPFRLACELRQDVAVHLSCACTSRAGHIYLYIWARASVLAQAWAQAHAQVHLSTHRTSTALGPARALATGQLTE